MASIFKRGDIWYLKYYVHGQQVYQSLGTTSERVARKRQIEVEADETRGDLIAPSATPLPAFLEDFTQFLATIRTAKSYSGDISLLRVFFGPICPALQLGSHVNRRFRDGQESLIPDPFKRRHVPAKTLEDITPEVIETFISRRMRLDKIAPKTANRQREILHRMFAYAIKNWHFTAPDRRYPNPAAAVERRREPAPQIRYLTDQQILEQLQVLEDAPLLRVMVATYIYAGLRREEGLWLTPADVDLERRLLQVRAKTIEGKFWQPKTKRNRIVPISAALGAILAAYHPSGPWYFPSPQGRRWDTDNFSQTLREKNQKHGLVWSCLDFRHTFGSHLAQKGESLLKIAELMGNSPDICRRHYAALCPEKMHDVVEFGQAPSSPALTEKTAQALLAQLQVRADRSTNPQVPYLRLVQ